MVPALLRWRPGHFDTHGWEHAVLARSEHEVRRGVATITTTPGAGPQPTSTTSGRTGTIATQPHASMVRAPSEGSACGWPGVS